MQHAENPKKASYFKKIGGMLAIYVGAFFMMFALSTTLASSAEVDRSTPDGLIKTLTECVVKALQDDPALQSNDTKGLITLIDREILPYTNIEKTTRSAVGPNWKKATLEQRQELIQQFKTLLIYTYAGALANNRHPEMEVLPFTLPANSRDVVIKTRIMRQGQPIEVAYRLSKEQAIWSLYDISVAGVWLVQNYRQQFEETLSRSGIPGLIQTLQQQNVHLTGRA